jgi:hypothetical protein
MSGGLENCSVVIFENRQPGCDVGGVVFSDFRRKFEVCAKKCSSEFADEFFVA